MSRGCGYREARERWAAAGSAAPLPELLGHHAETCAACGALVRDVTEVRELFSSMPAPRLTSRQIDAIRFRLQSEARALPAIERPRPRSRWPRLGMAALVFGLLALVFTVSRSRPSPASLARLTENRSQIEVRLSPGAVGRMLPVGTTSLYRLAQGRAEFTVPKLAPHERFRVESGQEWVEVRGTRFSVLVDQAQLREVKVEQGKVWLALESGGLLLEAGRQWSRERGAENAAASPPRQPSGESQITARELEASEKPLLPTPSSARGGKGSAETPPAVPSRRDGSTSVAVSGEIDLAFQQAMKSLSEGRAASALGLLDQLRRRSDLDAGRRADIEYWSAVAAFRSGGTRLAEARLGALLRSGGAGWHKPEAELLLGELLLTRGARSEARLWLSRAQQSARPAVSRRASRLLQALAPPDPQPDS